MSSNGFLIEGNLKKYWQMVFWVMIQTAVISVMTYLFTWPQTKKGGEGPQKDSSSLGCLGIVNVQITEAAHSLL